MTSQPVVRSLRDLNQLVPKKHAPSTGSVWTAEFTEPHTIEEAEDRYQVVTADVRTIQSQLSDRNRVNVFGHRLNDHEFHQWRGKAVAALSVKQSQSALLKTWIKRHHRAVAQRPDDYTAIRNAHLLLKTWWDGGDPDETLTKHTVAQLEDIVTRLAAAGASTLDVVQ